MATDPARRQILARLAALGCGLGGGLSGGLGFASLVHASVHPTSGTVRLAAAWQRGSAHQIGILNTSDSLTIAAAIDVPTRAHALLQLSNQTLLAVARRPGHWLLRWSEQGEALAWKWIEPGRAFTGHAVSDGQRLYVAETNLETGAGLIGVRDLTTLEKLAEWPTHGIDPHQIVFDAEGHLMVANGGVPTRPETGRAKLDLSRMDSSLVRLHSQTGALLEQWRLADPRLSMRHLAWHGQGAEAVLGIALQAEHDDPVRRQVAPVLAFFEHGHLSLAETVQLQGYGGSIVATEDGFAVSCPRAHAIVRFDRTGRLRDLHSLAEACALDVHAGALWAGGLSGVQAIPGATHPLPLAGLRLDNHWLILES